MRDGPPAPPIRPHKRASRRCPRFGLQVRQAFGPQAVPQPARGSRQLASGGAAGAPVSPLALLRQQEPAAQAKRTAEARTNGRSGKRTAAAAQAVAAVSPTDERACAAARWLDGSTGWLSGQPAHTTLCPSRVPV